MTKTKKVEKTVTISMEKFESLQDSLMKLDCLEACGVDNWGGYDDAMEMLQDMRDGVYD